MIRSFRHRGLKRLYHQGSREGLGANLIAPVERGGDRPSQLADCLSVRGRRCPTMST